jgi:two-component system sensor kinase FixL
MPILAADEGMAMRDDADAARARLRAVLDAAVDAIITIDEAGIIDSVNPATQRMFGYRAGDMIGHNVSMLMPAEHRSHHDAYLARYLSTGEKRIIGIGREVECRRQDGSLVPCDLAVNEFRLNGQRMFTGILRDISDRRQALRAAQERLDELAHAGRLADLGMTTSTIAHEVNQPLTAIVGFANAAQRMLRSDSISTTTLADVLGQIAAQSSRASEIIARIRELARKRETVTERMDMNAAVRAVLGLLRDELERGRVGVQLDLDAATPPVMAERIHVEQIVMNLVRNASEAMRDAGVAQPTLRIIGRHDARHATLSVCDNGPGLGAGGEDRVFQSFYTTKSSGLGVGLSICRDLAQAHGGRLWADADHGDGARFHLALLLGSDT